MATDQRSLDLHPLRRLLWHGRFIIFLGALIGTISFGYYALFVADPVYRATTVVILETRTGEIADIDAVLTELSGELPEINTEIEVLRGRALMGQVVDILDLTKDPEFNGALVPDGWQTRIKHRLRSLIMAQDPPPPTLTWEREAAINALISHVSITAVPASFVFRITAESSAPEKAALIADTVARAYMDGQIARKEAVTRDALTVLKARVDQLGLELAEAESRLSAFASSHNVTPGAAQTGNTAGQIGQTLRELTQYEREAEATRDLYRDFLGRMKETEALLGMIRPDSRVLSAAVVPNYHVEPRRVQLITMGLIFGLVGALAMILLREAMANTYRQPADLAANLRLPVLGQMPDVPAKGRAGVVLHLAERPTSPAAEAVRGVRTSLLGSGAGTLPKVILCTAAKQDEGTTTLSVALAQNIAAMGKSVVLVDADLRQSAMDEVFGAGTGKGLMSVLSGDAVIEDALFTAQPYGFDVLFGMIGGFPGVPDTLSSDRFADLVALMRDTYDVVIIDAPPALLVPDARILARLADHVVFAVRACSTTRTEAAEALKAFREIPHLPVALVLTRGPSPELPRERTRWSTTGRTAYFGQ